MSEGAGLAGAGAGMSGDATTSGTTCPTGAWCRRASGGVSRGERRRPALPGGPGGRTSDQERHGRGRTHPDRRGTFRPRRRGVSVVRKGRRDRPRRAPLPPRGRRGRARRARV